MKVEFDTILKIKAVKLTAAAILAAFLLAFASTETYAGICVVDSRQPCGAYKPEKQFVEIKQNPDSFLNRRAYAFLEDFSHVYPEPSAASQPLYNVGEGFFYVTLAGQKTNELGEVWYQINPGQYVRQENIKAVQISDFAGIALQTQPDRPFGWILARVQPSSQPGAEPNENFAKLERYTFFQVFDAVEAADGWLWYNIGGEKWIRQTFVGLIDVDPRPEGVGANEFWTEVDLYEQTFAAYQGDQMVFATLISSGLNRWPTREGLFQVAERVIERKMSGAEGKVDYYFVEDVPHALYFDQLMGIALHGAYWHDRFGYKHSHGCVNMPPLSAEWTYDWSSNAPNDLWVWVHSSDPRDYFKRFAQGASQQSDSN